MSTAFIGTRHLIRLILRRDRIRLPIWIVSLTAVTCLLYTSPSPRD